MVSAAPHAGEAAVVDKDAGSEAAEARNARIVECDHRRIAGPAHDEWNGNRHIVLALLNAGLEEPKIVFDLRHAADHVLRRPGLRFIAGCLREVAVERGAAQRFGKLLFEFGPIGHVFRRRDSWDVTIAGIEKLLEKAAKSNEQARK